MLCLAISMTNLKLGTKTVVTHFILSTHCLTLTFRDTCDTFNCLVIITEQDNELVLAIQKIFKFPAGIIKCHFDNILEWAGITVPC